MNNKRVFLIVLDSLGAGEAPDAEVFGDVGSNTIKSLYNTGRLDIPNLKRLGIGKIDGLDFLDDGNEHIGAVAVPMHCGLFDEKDMNDFKYENKIVPEFFKEIKLI